MSAYATATMTASTEMTAIQPIVKIGGHIVDWCTCLQIEQSAGIVPSKALLRIGGNAYDVSGNLTLNAYNYGFKQWSEVEILDGNDTLFLGLLQKRRDVGQANNVIWEAWDYRWFLSTIPVRGCLVWDKAASAVKFISRYVCRVNPDGGFNCMPAVVDNVGLVPVFSSYSDEGMGYSTTVSDSAMAAGELTCWTPQKFIMYLCALANIQPGGVPGTYSGWRAMKADSPVQWRLDSCQFDGSNSDTAMNKKMPDTTFQGKTILASLVQALQIGGGYGLNMTIGKASTGSKAFVSFYTHHSEDPEYGHQLYLQRGGSASDIISIVDFELEEDASETRGQVLVEGAPRRVEARLESSKTETGSETLLRGWTPDEQAAFLAIIAGNGTYARIPSTVPDITGSGVWTTAVANGVLCDGAGGRPLAQAKTQAAISQARQYLPRVFRAFYINTQAAYDGGLIKGAAEEYQSMDLYPYLKQARPIHPEQAQHFVNDASRKLRERFPVRIEVQDSDNKWHDVRYNCGLRVTEDGSIFFDGLTDDTIPEDTVYTGRLSDGSALPTGVRINCLFPMDHRATGVSANSTANGQVDSKATDALNGPPLLYIDNPEGFRENHQVQSYPLYAGLPGATSTPITRVLDDDRTAIQSHAQRRLQGVASVRRLSSWIMPGIRSEFYAGMYIRKVVVSGQTGDVDYQLDAPIEQLTFNFQNQTTCIGGLLSTSFMGEAKQTLPMDTGRLVRTKPEPPKPVAEPKPMRQLAMAKKPFEKFTEE